MTGQQWNPHRSPFSNFVRSDSILRLFSPKILLNFPSNPKQRMFNAVGTDVNFPKQEEAILEFWKSQDIYAKSLAARAGGKPFVFFEGPPTANGMPHPGHCLTRAIKDLFPRYRTMCGFHCERRAGWDTHGLPVEVEVCKELGIHSKEEIEAYGIEPFIKKCQQSVWRYMQEWERLTNRIGFWIDLSQAYVTYHQSYIESVWWSLKDLFDRGLLYRGHKIVWWWAQGGTALSAGEVGQGYREVADPSVYVRFPIDGEPNTSLLVWTTTPWTLPSNQFAAINPKLKYAYCLDEANGQTIVLAEDLMADVSEKAKLELKLIKTVSGAELVGKTYRPPFDYYYASQAANKATLVDGGQEQTAWRIVAADFVTIDSGSGAVHIAPAFGEIDYGLLIDEQSRFVDGSGPKMICAVGPDGKFTDVAPEYVGQWVKDTDKAIIRQLRDNGLLFLHSQYVHDYPFCWRAESDPLIQYPRESWFIRTTQFRDAMLENNQKIGWQPEHIKDGRFGNFLESNVDWALSRERYWGTPLPIWVCDATGKMEAISSYDELLAKPDVRGTEVWDNAKAADPTLVDDLRVHKPYIDAVNYQSPFQRDARMRRVSEVIDCWYDSGAMPFAQWGYPHKNKAEFQSHFPADFISEAIDQTRGWFYSQLAISTMLFSHSHDGQGVHAYPHPFKNCIVLGLMLAEWYESKDGKQRFLSEDEAKAACGKDYVSKTGKMSKSLRNYRSPNEIFDRFGADALRWYFYANQPPWNSILYSERAIRDSIPEFMLRLWNVLSFFTIYAEIDKFTGPSNIEIRGLAVPLEQLTAPELDQSPTYRRPEDRSELDRWMLGELHACIDDVRTRMDRYDSYGACQALTELVDAMSNWFVRRSRNRFWAEDTTSPDKLDAYWTLYECLITISKMIAPFTPFVAESIWRNLSACVSDRVRESVHLCDYPVANAALIDRDLSAKMKLLREIASLGRSARMESRLKVRQPLSRVEVTLIDDAHAAWLKAHDEIVREELNVKEIHYASGSNPYIKYEVLPNFRGLGPKVGKLLPKLKAVLGNADGRALLDELTSKGSISLSLDGTPIELDSNDVEIRLKAKEGWAAAQGKACVVVLATELTDELIAEGIARDAIRLIQDQRKKQACNFTDRIRVTIGSDKQDILAALKKFEATIVAETLATELVLQTAMPSDSLQDLGDSQVGLQIDVVG